MKLTTKDNAILIDLKHQSIITCVYSIDSKHEARFKVLDDEYGVLEIWTRKEEKD